MGIPQGVDHRPNQFDHVHGADGFEFAAMKGQVFTVDIFHGDERQLIRSMKIKNADDVGMDQQTGVAAFIF